MTALPVLGAILREMDLLGSRIGHLALGIAGINDVALWILLSVLLTARAGQAAGGPMGLATLLLVPLYLRRHGAGGAAAARPDGGGPDAGRNGRRARPGGGGRRDHRLRPGHGGHGIALHHRGVRRPAP